MSSSRTARARTARRSDALLGEDDAVAIGRYRSAFRFVPGEQQGPFIEDPLAVGQVRLEVGQEVVPEVGVIEPAGQGRGAPGQGAVEPEQGIGTGEVDGPGRETDLGPRHRGTEPRRDGVEALPQPLQGVDLGETVGDHPTAVVDLGQVDLGLATGAGGDRRVEAGPGVIEVTADRVALGAIGGPGMDGALGAAFVPDRGRGRLGLGKDMTSWSTHRTCLPRR